MRGSSKVTPAGHVRRYVRGAVIGSLVAAMLASSGCSLLPFGDSVDPVVATTPKASTPTVDPAPAAKPKPKPKVRLPKAVDRATAQRLAKDGARLIDLRPETEHKLIHPKGSISVPVEKMSATAKSWSKDSGIVLLSTQDVVSRSVGKYLRKRGYTQVYYLKGGLWKWDGAVEGEYVTVKYAETKSPAKPILRYYYVEGDPLWARTAPAVAKWKQDFKGEVEFDAQKIGEMPVWALADEMPDWLLESAGFGALMVVIDTQGGVQVLAGDLTRTWAYLNSAVEREARTEMRVYRQKPSTW